MIKELKKLIFQTMFICCLGLFSAETAKAENQLTQQETVEMADTFREEGKIYVLTGIILIILLGFFGYAFNIERKVTKIEKNIENKS